MKRRDFLAGTILFFPASAGFAAVARLANASASTDAARAGGYDPAGHYYGMGIEIDKCIGCNRCVEACKSENDVPQEPFYFRTWVERYSILQSGEAHVECISTREARQAEVQPDPREVLRSFFVPKLCNQCAHPPCVQVCPVGATFATKDGVVLVDKDRCIGCRYCIQACPYGARYLHPKSRTADKCTFCYHRVTKGLLPACVEVCPTGARVFGDLSSKASRLVRLRRLMKTQVLKPSLNTKPKVFYAQMDGEVR